MSDLVDRARLRAHHHFLNTTTHDLFIECAARIEALEARNSDLVTQCDTHAQQKMTFKAHIEELEAALRVIMEHPAGLYEAQYDIARAALAPEQDK